MAKALAARLRRADERMWQSAAALQPPQTKGSAAKDSAEESDAKPRSDKQKIKDMLTDSVSWVYLLKSVTQFSLAVVGCPVNVNLETHASRSLVVRAANTRSREAGMQIVFLTISRGTIFSRGQFVFPSPDPAHKPVFSLPELEDILPVGHGSRSRIGFRHPRVQRGEAL